MQTATQGAKETHGIRSVTVYGISDVSVDWNQTSLIGQGGFASVYHGNLKDQQRTDVAIKRLLGVHGGMRQE